MTVLFLDQPACQEAGTDGGELEALVRAHEDGGWPEVDLIQAADSLSFLEDAVAAEVAES